MKKTLVLSVLFALQLCYSQATVQWSENSPGAGNYENHTVATDSQGNVYSTGTYTSPYDFDPGNGVFTMTCFASNMFILKLDAAGNFVWAKQIGGGASLSFSQGNAIAVDASDNIYIAGTATGFSGPIDFDPGAGTYNLTTPTSEADIFIEKLDSSGNFVWVKQIRNPTDTSYGLDNAQCIKADAAGNVYVTGGFGGTADFDPGMSTYNLTSTGNFLSTNTFILKLDVSGNFVWAKAMTHPSTPSGSVTDKGYGIDVDSAGNVYTTGYFWETIDADPGTGTHLLTGYTSNNPTESGSNNLFVSKLDASGNFVWAYSLSGDHNGAFHPALVVDNTDHIILSGYTDSALSNITDLDFGAGNYNLPVGNGAFVLKMDTSANLVWAKGTAQAALGTYSWGKGVAVDATGNIYTIGDFNVGAHDFDPGSGTYSLTPSNVDIYVSKLDTDGNFIWANKIGGAGTDNGFSIAVSPQGKVNVCGTAGTGGFDRSINTVAAGGFLASLSQPALGIEEIAAVDDFVVYPNPSNGDFNIMGDGFLGAKAEVFDMLGQKIKSFTLNDAAVSLHLPSGIYFLSIEKEGKKASKKLIVN